MCGRYVLSTPADVWAEAMAMEELELEDELTAAILEAMRDVRES